MIPRADTLHTIAEVGIAITGFAGIVAALTGILGEYHYFLDFSGLLWGLAASLIVFARVLSGSPSM